MKTSIKFHIVPNAKKTKVAGTHGDAVKIQVAAPPIEGRANKVLIAFIAKSLGLPKKEVKIKHGESGRSKTIEVNGMTKKEILDKLLG